MKKSSNPYSKGRSIGNCLPIGYSAPIFPFIEENLNKDILVHFFPNTNNSICKYELDTLKMLVNKYTQSNIKVVAIATDKQEDLDALKASGEYNFDIISDESKSISIAYKALLTEAKSNRSTYLISNGEIIWCDSRDNGRNMANYEHLFRGWRPSKK